MLALALSVAALLTACIVHVAKRRPWRSVRARSPSSGPYRASLRLPKTIERAPSTVWVAATVGVLHAQVTLIGLAFALATLRWDGIAVGLLPLGALGMATAVAGVELLRPDERTEGRVRVIARGLLAYGIPLVGFGLLHEVVLEQGMGTAMSFGVVGAALGTLGVVTALTLLAACKHLDDEP